MREHWRGTGPRPTVRGRRIGPTAVVCDRLITNRSRSGDLDLQRLFTYRSAGACPPRTLHGEGHPHACACGMARDRPSPYGEGTAHRAPLCSLCSPDHKRVRIAWQYARASDDLALQRLFTYRSAGACPPRTLHGEGHPHACACGMARDRPSPYGEGTAHRAHRCSL